MTDLRLLHGTDEALPGAAPPARGPSLAVPRRHRPPLPADRRDRARPPRLHGGTRRRLGHGAGGGLQLRAGGAGRRVPRRIRRAACPRRDRLRLARDDRRRRDWPDRVRLRRPRGDRLPLQPDRHLRPPPVARDGRRGLPLPHTGRRARGHLPRSDRTPGDRRRARTRRSSPPTTASRSSSPEAARCCSSSRATSGRPRTTATGRTPTSRRTRRRSRSVGRPRSRPARRCGNGSWSHRSTSPRPPRGGGPVHLTVGAPTGTRVPPIGLGQDRDAHVPDDHERELLRALAPAHLRTEVRLDTAGWLETLAAAKEVARGNRRRAGARADVPRRARRRARGGRRGARGLGSGAGAGHLGRRPHGHAARDDSAPPRRRRPHRAGPALHPTPPSSGARRSTSRRSTARGRSTRRGTGSATRSRRRSTPSPTST